MPVDQHSEAFRSSLHSAILGEAPDGILVIDDEDKIVSVNERFFTVWNIPRPSGPLDALIGTPEATILANPDDPRADDYPGEFIGGTNWGLHLIDVSIAQGDLVRLAGQQARAYLGR